MLNVGTAFGAGVGLWGSMAVFSDAVLNRLAVVLCSAIEGFWLWLLFAVIIAFACVTLFHKSITVFQTDARLKRCLNVMALLGAIGGTVAGGAIGWNWPWLLAPGCLRYILWPVLTAFTVRAAIAKLLKKA